MSNEWHVPTRGQVSPISSVQGRDGVMAPVATVASDGRQRRENGNKWIDKAAKR